MKHVIPSRMVLLSALLLTAGCGERVSEVATSQTTSSVAGEVTTKAEPVQHYSVELVYVAPDGVEQAMAMTDPGVAEVGMSVTEPSGQTMQCVLQRLSRGEGDQLKFSYTIGTVTRSKTFGYAGSPIPIRKDKADDYQGQFVVRPAESTP